MWPCSGEEVVREIVPIVCEMKKEQQKRLHLPDFKFYDDPVGVQGGNPHPQGTFEDTYHTGIEMYRKMSPLTKDFINKMDSMHRD